MALRITCPGCKTSLELDDDARGRKVRCTQCEKVLSIPAAGGPKANRAKQEVVQGGGRKMPASVEDDEEREEERDEESERPAKKKKKKKAKSGGGIAVNFGFNSVYVLVGGVFILILAGAGVGAYYVLREPPEAPPAKLANAPAPPPMENPARKIIPGIKDGNPDKKGGTYVISSVRGAGYRVERKSELKQIGIAYIAFLDDYKGPERTYENFLKYIKRDYGVIHDYIKDGYYQMNMKAGFDSDSIIAYERDIDRTGYLCVRGDTSVDYVPLEAWKKALGKP